MQTVEMKSIKEWTITHNTETNEINALVKSLKTELYS